MLGFTLLASKVLVPSIATGVTPVELGLIRFVESPGKISMLTLSDFSTPPVCDILPLAIPSASPCPPSIRVIVIVDVPSGLWVSVIGTITQVLPIRLSYTLAKPAAFSVTTENALIEGPRVISNEKKPSGYEPSGGGGDRVDSATGVRLEISPVLVVNVTIPAPVVALHKFRTRLPLKVPVLIKVAPH